MAASRHSWLSVTATPVADDCVLLTTDGVLDGTTYLQLRDKIIKAALDEPRALIVDITILRVPAPSACAVFTSARWHTAQWPDVPISLVCAHLAGRNMVRRSGITRYVPVYRTIESAIDDMPPAGTHRFRRRARVELPARATSLRRCRQLADEWLTAWSMPDFVEVAKVVATTFVENVLAHSDTDFGMRVESDGTLVTVAVDASSGDPVVRHESTTPCAPLSSVDTVAALCRAWGCSTNPSGKGNTVWAVMGPENCM